MTDIIQPHLNKLRKDKFTMVLTIPSILRELNTRKEREDKFFNLDSLQFSIYNCQIPRHQVPEVPVHFGQQNYNVTSYDRPSYPPVVVNFEVDNEFKNYWVLWKWLQLINDPIDATFAGKNIFPDGTPRSEFLEYNKLVDDFRETETRYVQGNRFQPNRKGEFDFHYNYVTNIVIFAKDEYNNDKAKFLFKYAFITELGELDYNYRDSDQLSCQFIFVFNQMDMELLGDGSERI